jgi:hypothetical protein
MISRRLHQGRDARLELIGVFGGGEEGSGADSGGAGVLERVQSRRGAWLPFGVFCRLPDGVGYP